MIREEADEWLEFLKESSQGTSIEMLTGYAISAHKVAKILLEDNVKLQQRIEELEKKIKEL